MFTFTRAALRAAPTTAACAPTAAAAASPSLLEAVAARIPDVVRSVIAGRPVHSTSGRTYAVPNAATGGTLCTLDVAGQAEVDAAVVAAAAAQEEWAATPGAQRARVLRGAAEVLRRRNDELAEVEALDTGRPIAETKYVDVASAYECLEFMAGLAATTASTGQHIQLAGGAPDARYPPPPRHADVCGTPCGQVACNARQRHCTHARGLSHRLFHPHTTIPPNTHMPAQHTQLRVHTAAAAGRVCRHWRMELPHPGRGVEGCPGARVRQLHHLQAR